VPEETDLIVGQDLSVAAYYFTDLQSGSLGVAYQVSLIKPVVPVIAPDTHRQILEFRFLPESRDSFQIADQPGV
jgi:hypothetical protein